MKLFIFVGIIQVLKFEFPKFRILEILNFHSCSYDTALTLPVSGKLFCLLITFANSLDPDQAFSPVCIRVYVLGFSNLNERFHVGSYLPCYVVSFAEAYFEIVHFQVCSNDDSKFTFTYLTSRRVRSWPVPILLWRLIMK